MIRSKKTFQSFREKTRSVVREASQKNSLFESWSSDSLKNILIEHNVQVRGSNKAARRTLVRICDELFEGQTHTRMLKEEDFRRVYTMEEMLLMDRAARAIQWIYIEHRQRRTWPLQFGNIVVDVMEGQGGGSERYTFHNQDHQNDQDEEQPSSYYDEGVAEGQGEVEGEVNVDGDADVLDEEEQHRYYNAHQDETGIGYEEEATATVNDDDQQHYHDGDSESNESRQEDQKDQEQSERRSGLIDEEYSHSEESRGDLTMASNYSYESRNDDNSLEAMHHNSSSNSNSKSSSQKSNYTSMHENAEKNHSEQGYHSPPHDGVAMVTSRGREAKKSKSMNHQRQKSKQLDHELDTEWVKPSWKQAKLFEAENRPHQSGKEMKPYHCRDVTLGRHCTIGGCGEQLDLWDEGQMSEFAQFGSGITNYFKFLKWCCWIMFILSVIHIPILVFNVLGTTLMNDGSMLAMTTLGNLGASNIDYIEIPGCDNSKYQVEQCRLSKDELAVVYSSLDAIGTIVVILGYYWLKVFERKEVDHLNRTTVTASDYTLRVSRIPVNMTEIELAAHFAELTSSPIADVNLAFKNAEEIKMYSNRGQVMKQRNKCIQRIRYERSRGEKVKGGKSASLRRVKKLLRERQKLTSLLDIRDAERTIKINSKPDALQAFITFDTEEGFVKAISAYQINWIRSISCFYPKRLRIGGAKVRVDQAPEPSTIIWENIEVKERSRFLRKCITTCIASLAILLSVYFTFVARDFKIETLQSMSGQCPTFFDSLTSEEQYELVDQDISLSHCFCEALEAQAQLEEPICRDFVKNKIRASSMSYGAGFMVCFMNMFFTILMDRAGSFEKHQSLDDMESSNMTRLFVLKFLNTGCLVLLYSLRFVQKLVGVNFGDPQNFNIDWYETGGVGVVIVMVINIFTPHIGSLISYRSHQKRKRKLESSLDKNMDTKDEEHIWYTQEDLNAVYLGPPFRLNYRYTQLLVNFYICWMYAVSMPLLPLIGTVSFFVSFWVDKFLFCNFYRIPPSYSHAIGSRSTILIGYGIIFHIFMSCWILGNNQIFSGVSIVKNKKVDVFMKLSFTDIILKRHIVILEIVAVLFISHIVIKKFTTTFSGTLVKILRCLICGKGNRVKKIKAKMNAVQVTYGGAKARGVIKGLASYNILQNPKYQEAFAITPAFAQNHKHLSEIRGYNTKEKCISSCSDGDSFGSDASPVSV